MRTMHTGAPALLALTLLTLATATPAAPPALLKARSRGTSSS
jgi:hypothetical protein